MQLALRLKQNLAVNQQIIARNQQRLPYAIANYYLQKSSSNSESIKSLQQQIKQAQERLEWFAPLLQRVAEIENLIVKSPHFFDPLQYQELLRKWIWAIDQIGDLNQSQELIYRFVTRLQWLINSWELVNKTYYEIEEIVSAGPEEEHRSLLQQFVEYWQVLWSNLADLTNLDADLAVRDALQKLTNLEIKIEVNV